jgi:hypothetical protein
MKTTISESSEFQYYIELGLDGMMDHSSMGLSYAERLVKLRDQRKAWNDLNWKTLSVVPIQGLCHAYELVEGIFVKSAGRNDFSISWLPSATTDGHQIHREILEILARDFAIDPGQDLIVLVEDPLHFFFNAHLHPGKSPSTRAGTSDCKSALFRLMKPTQALVYRCLNSSFPRIQSWAPSFAP